MFSGEQLQFSYFWCLNNDVEGLGRCGNHCKRDLIYTVYILCFNQASPHGGRNVGPHPVKRIPNVRHVRQFVALE